MVRSFSFGHGKVELLEDPNDLLSAFSVSFKALLRPDGESSSLLTVQMLNVHLSE